MSKRRSKQPLVVTAKRSRDRHVTVYTRPGATKKAGRPARRVGTYEDFEGAVEAMLDAFDEAIGEGAESESEP